MVLGDLVWVGFCYFVSVWEIYFGICYVNVVEVWCFKYGYCIMLVLVGLCGVVWWLGDFCFLEKCIIVCYRFVWRVVLYGFEWVVDVYYFICCYVRVFLWYYCWFGYRIDCLVVFGYDWGYWVGVGVLVVGGVWFVVGYLVSWLGGFVGGGVGFGGGMFVVCVDCVVVWVYCCYVGLGEGVGVICYYFGWCKLFVGFVVDCWFVFVVVCVW